MTDLFKQLDSLCIKAGEKKVKLFKKTVGGVVPVEDVTLERRVKEGAKSQQEQTDLIKRAKAYLRLVIIISLTMFPKMKGRKKALESQSNLKTVVM